MKAVQMIIIAVLGISFLLSACSEQIVHEPIYRAYCTVEQCTEQNEHDHADDMRECISDMNETGRKISRCEALYVDVLECYSQMTCSESIAFESAEEVCDERFENDASGYIACVGNSDVMKQLDLKCSGIASSFWACIGEYYTHQADEIF
jgi:hypothetical protein